MFIQDLTQNIYLPAKKRLGQAAKQAVETVTQAVEPVKNNLDEFLSMAFNDATRKNNRVQAADPMQSQDVMFAKGSNIPPQTPKKPKIDIEKALKAIAYNETRGVAGDKYAFSRDSGDAELGKAIGTYQVTAGELKILGPELFGRNVTEQEFQNSPELQDEYMRKKVQEWADEGLSLEAIAALHNKGFSRYRDEGVIDERIKKAGDYVPNLVNYYNSL